MIKFLSRNRVLYSDLPVEKCVERLKDDIGSYCGRGFTGGNYNDYVWVSKIVRRRHRDTEVTFSGTIEKYNGGTRILYKIKNPFYLWILLAPVIIAVIALIIPFLEPDIDFQSIDRRMLIYPLVIVWVVFTAVITAEAVYHERALFRFVKIMFNVK